MQGIYRVQGAGSEYLESFVAAPGPAGWRYFGRVSSVESEAELFTVDFVVDADWRLVRYREGHADGSELLAAHVGTGIQIARQLDHDERDFDVPDAEVIWSSSPCSLLIAQRRASASRVNRVIGARIDGESPIPLTISFPGSDWVNGTLEVGVDGQVIRCVVDDEAPVSADGWFERIS